MTHTLTAILALTTLASMVVATVAILWRLR